MNTTKPWYASLSVWGSLTTLLASALGLLKFRVDPALLSDLSDWLLSAVTLASGAAALYGRLRATRRIGSPDPALQNQNWRNNSILLLFLLSLVSLPGCAALSPASLAADRATYNVVAPEYAAYVDSDPNLTDEEKSRRLRTLQSWQLRLDQAEAPATPH